MCFGIFGYVYSEKKESQKENSTETSSSRKLRKKYLEELTEDVEELAKTLEGLGVKVHKPMTLSHPIKFKTPYWEATCIPTLNVRDQAIIIGNEIIETPPQIRE